MNRSLWFVLPFFAFLTSENVKAGTYKFQVDFQSQWRNGVWQGEYYEEPGLPKIPMVEANILLKPGEKIESAQFEPTESRDFRRFDFKTVPYSIPSCAGNWRLKPVEEFAEGEVFPLESMGSPSLFKKFGYTVAQIPLFAVKYFPATKDGIAMHDGVLVVETKQEKETLSSYRALASDRESLGIQVINPDNFANYPELRRDEPAPNYLVIGPKAFLQDEALSMFLAEKVRRGLTTTTLTLEDIEGTFSGDDQQEKVRAAVAKYYETQNTKYVLLVGNGYSVLPTRKVSVSGESIATDMYFACLDNDGPPSDLACEVALGRAPVSTLEEFRVFLSKTLKMELVADNDPRLMNELNFGEEMDGSTLACSAINQVLAGGQAGSISTVGYPDSINATKMCETHSSHYSANDVIEAMNGGNFYTVNHMGHASESYCMRFKTSNIPSLTNNLPFFGISGGCHPGNITGPNWAAKMVTHPTGGAGAMIANSSFGWFSPGSSDGPSNRHLLMFYDAVFNEGYKNLGVANMRSKERLASQAGSNSTLKKVLVETNLLGDPELLLKIKSR